MPRLLSVNVGLPREIEWQGKVVRTAIWKRPVSGRVLARRLNLDGDGQGDLKGHGGEQRAVMVYQIEAYRYWERELGRNDFEYGQFGENFTVEGLPDDEVCIGDRYRIGTAVFEVTQPRVTCYRLGIRMNNPQMAACLFRTGGQDSIAVSSRKVKLVPETKFRRSRRDRTGSRSLKLILCSIRRITISIA